MTRLAAGLAVWLGVLGLGPPDDLSDIPPWNRTPIATAPFLANGQSRFGQLDYAGGLYLTAPKSELFGGVSGLEAEPSPDGTVHFEAITDTGSYLRFTGRLDEAGKLVGASDLVMAPLRDLEGKPVQGKEQSDAEDLSRLPDGSGVLVSFERHHRIWLYADPLNPAGQVTGVNVPAAAKLLPPNLGMEAVAALSGRRMLVGAEDGRMWLCPPTEDPCPLVHGKGGMGVLFYLTGLDTLPGVSDELVASYRRPNPLGGVDSIIARVVLRDGRADVTELARLPRQVDNVEGITAVAGPNGAWRLYIVTDNNFDPKLPTRLLAFDWRP